MDEFANPKFIKPITGLLNLYLPESKKFQLISLQDIGRFAEIAIENPAEYISEEIEIAGDELTLHEVFEKIEKVKNIKIFPMKIPRFVKWILPEIMKQMFVFYAKDGWNADIESLKKENPELLSFEDWLKTTDVF